MNHIIILLILSISASIVLVIQIRKSRISNDAKILLYLIAVTSPVIGFVIFYFFNRNKEKSTIE